MSLDDLYQSLILDHNRRPRNQGPLEGADREVHGHNPLCGDQVTIRLRMDGSTIADVRFEGSGCAISRASASMMTTAVKGRTTAQALTIFDRFHELVTGIAGTGGDPAGDAVEFPRGLAAFAGVARFPLRVKCATMAWHALRSALDEPAPGGDAASGDAASGDAASGDAASGDAASGDAASGDAASGDASDGAATS
ncbi:MAG: Fe-S cluster assembly sulfur transfer protein SufU [Gemmatimonadaceae bacterium]